MENELSDGWKRGLPKHEGVENGLFHYYVWYLKGAVFHVRVDFQNQIPCLDADCPLKEPHWHMDELPTKK